MAWMDPLTLVVVGGNVLGAAMAIPQAHKIRRTRRADGVSPAWAGISATVNAWWGVYALGVGDWSIFPVSVVSVAAYLVIAGTLLRVLPDRRGALGVMVAASLVVAIVPLVALGIAGWAVAGISLGALYGVQLTPAVVAVYRAIDVSGVSTATWTIAFAEAVLWGIYGTARLDAGLVALAVTGSAMSALVLARLFVRRPRRSRVAAPAWAPA